MKRRTFIRSSLIGAAALATIDVKASVKEAIGLGTASAPAPFEFEEATLADLQSGMTSGKIYRARPRAKNISNVSTR